MRIRVVAGAVIAGGRVLCAQRGPAQRHPGLWELPGGKVELGETDQAALKRELLEELDIVVEVGTQLGTSDHDYPDLRVRLVAYRCTVLEGKVQALEHAQVRWVSPQDLPALDWAPADRPLVAMLSG
jgi:8-oxo-dGTP diphosphatase